MTTTNTQSCRVMRGLVFPVVIFVYKHLECFSLQFKFEHVFKWLYSILTSAVWSHPLSYFKDEFRPRSDVLGFGIILLSQCFILEMLSTVLLCV